MPQLEPAQLKDYTPEIGSSPRIWMKNYRIKPTPSHPTPGGFSRLGLKFSSVAVPDVLDAGDDIAT